MMNDVLKPYLGDFCNVYIDDVIIYSRTAEEHVDHLSKVLQALSTAHLKINAKKSEFFQSKVVFLGRVFDGSTKTTKQESIDRISKLVRPYNVHSLRVFLGLAGHFRSFIKDYSKITKCLTELTKKEVPFEWSNQCENAYQDLIKRISSDPVLTLPDFQLPFELNTDASHFGTGAVLYQRDTAAPSSQQLRVIGYYSFTFSKTQINYTTTEKEALAVLMAVRYFRSYLDGKKFKLYTDHQALTYLLGLTEPKGKLARWINELQQFEFEVNHRPGNHLTDADALSRLAVDLPLEEAYLLKVWEGTEQLKFEDGKYTVPETLIPKVLELYHDSPESGGHDGFWHTYNKLLQRFRWHHMKEDVWTYVKSCHLCQVHKAKYHQRTDEMVIQKHSGNPFETIHLDFAELKKKSTGVLKTQSFLVCIDQCTRMVAARPGKEDANSVISLLERDIFKPVKIIISDNGPAFISKRLRDWAQQRGITLQRTVPSGSQWHGRKDHKRRQTVYDDVPDLQGRMEMLPRGGSCPS